MKLRKFGYWSSTGAVALMFALGGFLDLVHAPPAVAGMVALGYPVYVATILGFWKLLGAAALLAPRLPRLKEWAYAGIVFDLTGAAFSHASVGDPASKIAIPLVLLGIALGSWALRPESRKLSRFGARTSQPDELSAPASAERLAA
jgi:uncharacterized membrane protein YphA (DoxX/SURF4 family)